MRNRGFLIVAENTKKTDYVNVANTLAKSIKRVMPDERIALLTNNIDSNKIGDYYDFVVRLHDITNDVKYVNKDWKLYNDCQVYDLSPFDETIKIEADMYIPRTIHHWFNICKHQDVVVCTNIRDVKGNISNERFYRKTFDNFELPDTYNAITYFKKSHTAEYFYALVRDIFCNWDEYGIPEEPTTDVVYGIASALVGIEKTTLNNTDISFIHMKQQINMGRQHDWTKEFTIEMDKDTFRINTHSIMYPLHYYIKDFSKAIDNEFDDRI